MVVMGIHVRHIRHRAGPLVAMTVVFLIMMVSIMFVVVPVVVSSGRGANQLGGDQLRVESVAGQQVVVVALFHCVAVV